MPTTPITVIVPPLIPNTVTARLTPAVHTALIATGNVIGPLLHGNVYHITLYRPPPGLRVDTALRGRVLDLVMRLAHESPWGDEVLGVLPWECGMFVPCPECGAALVEDEAGDAPGACICLEGHLVQLSVTGRSAVLGRWAL